MNIDHQRGHSEKAITTPETPQRKGQLTLIWTYDGPAATFINTSLREIPRPLRKLHYVQLIDL